MLPTNSKQMNIPLTSGKLIDQTRLQVGPNLADKLPISKLQDIYLWMHQHYILPQLNGRRPYEEIWKLLYDAYRMRFKIKDIKLNKDDSKFLQTLIERTRNRGGEDVNLSDTLIFDTVDRMANLTHFITWKDDVPIQFNPIKDKVTPLEDRFYSPETDKYKAGNALFQHFASKEQLYRKTRISSKDYYLYGVCFCLSNFNYSLQQTEKEVTIKNLDITYEPISIMKVWINFMLPLSNMGQQPCPFWYEYSSHFAILQNEYDPALNPFGYVNLDKLDPLSYSNFSSVGEKTFKEALEARMQSAGQNMNFDQQLWQNVAAKWTFCPMLPLDPLTGDFEIYGKDHPQSGKRVPFHRYTWEHFGTDIIAAKIMPIRLQCCDHYGDELPIYGSTHLEDLNSAAYGMSICEALIDYAIELSTGLNQYLENKNQINNPPTWHQVGDPSYNQDVNKAGSKVEVVNGMASFGWKTVPDATGTTVNMMEHIRDRAQTTSKAVDAIMGKAMGGRTSATEAQNAFQAAMSGVTTDINMFNFDTAGGYATRLWKWAGWLDIDLLKAITGSYGLELRQEDRDLAMSLKFDVGSSFIESIVKQGHIRYFIEIGSRRPDVIDLGELLIQMSDELKIKGLRKCIIPDGSERNIAKAYDQCINTYLDKPVMIDPTQDHRIAIEVKTRFLEDVDSVWNVNYGSLPYQGSQFSRAQYIAQQIEIHTRFYQIQMQQEMMQQIANLQMQAGGAKGIPSLSEGSNSRQTMPTNQGN